ncbi:ATP-grasp domain-containing protein [Paractinoplanes ferrugineus]|uniref:ATP-grasp domain-containing protein n=1 Tax=Paractinoplanes ferrugineus TaxID=113564 RepID=UPI0031D94BCE
MSAREARGLDEDEELALPALRAAGVEAEVVNWDDPAVRWASYDRVVLRSTWDYPQRLGEFRRWLDAVAEVTDLRNPVPMVRWSLDKHYLAELDAAGVPVTPTVFAEPGSGEEPVFPDGEFVVKPAIGAGSRDAAGYGPAEHDVARAHVRRLHEGGASVLIQPLLKSVEVDGEWPLVFFAGQYSHAAGKRVALPRAGVIDELFAEETNAPYVADDEQIAVARRVIDIVTSRFGVPLYARVDLVRDDDGKACVLEVELVEPSLFLPQAPPEAVARLVAASTATG